MSETTEPSPAARPRASLGAILLATAGCVGYAPFAPGTFGSLEGVFIYWLIVRRGGLWSTVVSYPHGVAVASPLLIWVIVVTGFISGFGLLASHDVWRETGQKDPQYVVIDEVSGQLLTYLVALAPANWKYLLLGFILFRVFDIWKPFPARQAESFPGGWGIMADDWIAGIYAGIGLWIARAAGL
jgi:phosphatidylglycerophosphatase A